MTPLHYCCQSGWNECASLLLSVPGTEVNPANEDTVIYLGQSMPVYTCGGQTPLFLAVENGGYSIIKHLTEVGYPNIVKQLLDHKHIQPRHLDGNGRSVLDIL